MRKFLLALRAVLPSARCWRLFLLGIVAVRLDVSFLLVQVVRRTFCLDGSSGHHGEGRIFKL